MIGDDGYGEGMIKEIKGGRNRTQLERMGKDRWSLREFWDVTDDNYSFKLSES